MANALRKNVDAAYKTGLNQDASAEERKKSVEDKPNGLKKWATSIAARTSVIKPDDLSMLCFSHARGMV